MVFEVFRRLTLLIGQCAELFRAYLEKTQIQSLIQSTLTGSLREHSPPAVP